MDREMQIELAQKARTHVDKLFEKKEATHKKIIQANRELQLVTVNQDPSTVGNMVFERNGMQRSLKTLNQEIHRFSNFEYVLNSLLNGD